MKKVGMGAGSILRYVNEHFVARREAERPEGNAEEPIDRIKSIYDDI